MKTVSNFSLHNANGETVPEVDLLNWIEKQSTWKPFNTTEYSWTVDGKLFDRSAKHGRLSVLPDASGFICFESEWKPDNCILLDVFGKERKRLTVPTQLIGSSFLESAAAPTSFENVSLPYTHPASEKIGSFGVTAWVEHAGKFYFEMDYHNGQFLWCRQIRD